MYELHQRWIGVRYKNKTNHPISNNSHPSVAANASSEGGGGYKNNGNLVVKVWERSNEIWQDIAVKTCFLIAKWMSYRKIINVLIKWHYTTLSSIICLHSYVIRMHINVFVGDRSSDDRPTVVRLSGNERPMIDRCKTEEFPWVISCA